MTKELLKARLIALKKEIAVVREYSSSDLDIIEKTLHKYEYIIDSNQNTYPSIFHYGMAEELFNLKNAFEKLSKEKNKDRKVKDLVGFLSDDLEAVLSQL